ncbi:PilC/PilY family type IV pilus protein [Granulosicoccus sp.]|nr:PilC/PilY family type IV pilus protein [Granulosicoccus sp.]MDB4223384.1 PilC/PilY family type IV pilus protein [Granulosicoccus sp.]
MSLFRYFNRNVNSDRASLRFICFCCALTATCFFPIVQADDTEIFFSEVTGQTDTHPNVLFILDNSGSMRGTKLANMKIAMNSIIDSVSDVNIGMMNFTDWPLYGGRLVYPVTNVDEPGARAAMKNVVNGMSARTWTPIVRAYYEAAMALRGGSIEFGRNNYTSPMVGECQNNHIVILSDGEATKGQDTRTIRNLVGARRCENRNRDQACGVELARWLKTEDQKPDLDRHQAITTYTIGFNISSSFLSDLATEGGGTYFEAATANELTSVFEDILGEVSDVDTTFVAPARSVSQLNRLTEGNDLYFSLFKPQQLASWVGNLKRYQLGLSDGSIKILDKNLNEAVDPSTGFFKSSAKSFWSNTTDGQEVGLGGVVDQLAQQSLEGASRRKVFTYLGDVNNGPVTLERRDIDYRDEVHLLNEGITASYLPLDKRDSILRWARGYDERNENDESNTSGVRPHVGDPLHSTPAVVNYTDGPVVYFSTNEGFLHGIEASSGKELFSFIPKELLGNLTPLYINEESTTRTYGLDGHITVWHDDMGPFKNGLVDGDEKVYLYVGMRRGGRDYYAFDITNPNKPRFIWQIVGGSSEFPQLGQTWSKPVKARVMFNSVYRDVLIFGGGYNPNQDNELGATRRTDDYGNTIYMVDAETGEKIWNAEPITKWAEMSYSVPSDIRVLDTDSNGLADRMYVGDMGGQVWRFDIKQYHTTSDTMADFINGGVLADLGGDSGSNSIRFYNQPDAALINQEGERFFSLSIGSGWRAHPLDEQTNDRFYMIRDNSPLNVTGDYGRKDGSSYRAIKDSDLVDITISGGKSLSDIPHGWYLRMEDSGEKVLGKSITINNQVIFTSYTPGSALSVCEPAIGHSTAYVVKVSNGDPVLVGGNAAPGSDVITEFDKENRKKALNFNGIAPSPTAIIAEYNGAVVATLLIGTEELGGIDFSEFTRRTYWQDKLRGPNSPAELATE